MKNIYFVQVGFDFDGSVYLPYAAGTMIASAKAQGELAARFAFPDIIYRREKLNSAMEKLKNPYAVAFSCSVWNMEFNLALARLIKKKYPSCLVIFGGHSVKETGELSEQIPEIDILMFGEGEITFVNLLYGLLNDDIGTVENIAYRKNGKTVLTPRSYSDDISSFPSPYLTGVFDELMKKNPNTDWLCVLETNRGCPYSCAYCDWCAGKKMRHFPMEKVLGEIKWFAENKTEYIFCADSNFGMFDRDKDIARALVDFKKKYGYPKVFRPCYEKNSAQRVFEICNILNSEGMDKGATMAYQTLSDEALKNIGRKNLTLEHFSELLKKYTEAGIPTYSELILGLPGETYESFCNGICRLLENGQHNSVSVYHCEMLPNSRMADEDFIKEHGIKVIKVPFNHIHSAKKRDEEVPEYSYLVRATNTLPEKAWVQANLFSVTVQCFHSLGVIRCFSLYLYNEKNVAYADFFRGLLDFIIKSKGKIGELWRGFEQKYENSLSGDWNYHNEEFGNVTWFFEEGAFLEITDALEESFEEILPFLKGFGIENELFEQMCRYQKKVLRTYSSEECVEVFDRNFAEYYEGIVKGEPVKLKKERTKIKFSPKKIYASKEEYARETVWYGRRRGETVLHGKEIETV